MAATASASSVPRPGSSSTLPAELSSEKQVSVVEKLPAQSLTGSEVVKTTGTATASTTAATTKKKKKKKRHSPFRIKVGCIAALRYSDGGTLLKRVGGSVETTSPYRQVWTDPQPRRDQGLALIGRRVRCCFPKSVLANNGASTRIVEGEVVSIIDYETQWKQRPCCYTTVELLVDRKVLEALPFLERTDQDVDTSTMNSTEKKRQHFEDVIRGKNMVTVKANLADALGTIDKETASKNIVAKWVIRKRVPLPLKEPNGENDKAVGTDAENGSEPPRKKRKSKKDKSTTTMYIGDKNDPQAEQERNWRWLAGKYDDMLLSSQSGVSRPPQQLSFGMIGEVLKVEPTATNGKPSTLATVTLRRMILPEHSITGRLPHHGAVDIFDDADGSTETFQVPVEELVILSRKFERKYDTSNGEAGVGSGPSCPIVTRSYSYRSDSYRRLTTCTPADGEATLEVCHRCRKAEKKGSMKVIKAVSAEKDDEKLTCKECRKELRKSPLAKATSKCDCFYCSLRNKTAQEKLFQEQVKKSVTDKEKNDDPLDKSAPGQSAITLARSTVLSLEPVDFDLPNALMEFQTLPEPSEKLIITKSKRGRKSGKKAMRKAPATAAKNASGDVVNGRPDLSPKRLVPKVKHVQHMPDHSSDKKAEREEEEEAVFIPSCSRLTPYDLLRWHSSGTPTKRQMRMDDGDSSKPADRQSSACEDAKTPSAKKASQKRAREPERVSESKSTSRAARADQRRLKRGVAALGASGIGLDALAGREQQLRFDRSSIHAWGVFADEDINAGDMVIEYRGELIGNAVAEKREKEYEQAKIGSDYMFRIDGFIVCDATKQGNVARFINASCDPNCYTQIISLKGDKRIVIYAKRDIKAGEELCYDYKFPFEFDESKRIPCHCGAKDCRGFMNWDKRYVALPPPNTNTGAGGQGNAS